MEMKSDVRAQATSPVNRGIAVAAAILVVGVVGAIVAQFFMDAWADQYESAHWIQHGLLFWAGLMVGAGGLRLYQAGRRQA
jgi:hypothetical protein